MDINQLEDMANDVLELFMINPTKMDTRLRESMFHIDYKMHQSIYLRMDLEIEVKGLCWMKCTEIHDYMKLWDELLLNKNFLKSANK